MPQECIPSLEKRRLTGPVPEIFDRIAFLALRQRTNVDRISASIKKKKRVIPLNAPEEWLQLPVTIKIPMLRFPKGMLTFTRQKVGNEIFKSNPSPDFDLSDPNCNDVSYDYEPLHDHFMRRFSRAPSNLKRFREIGLIDDDNEVLCTLKQFNNYRQYLKRKIVVEMNRINAAKDEHMRDRLNFRVPQKMSLRYSGHYRKQQIQMERLEKLRAAAQERSDNLHLAQLQYERQLNRCDVARERQRLELEMASEQRQRLSDARREELAKKQKLRTITLKRKITIRDEQFRHRRLQQRRAAYLQHERHIAKSFANKMVWRQAKHSYDMQLLKDNDETLKFNEMQRIRSIAKERKKIEQGIVAKRAALIRNRYQSLTKDDIYQAMMKCVRKYDEKQIIQNETKMSSEGICGDSDTTISELCLSKIDDDKSRLFDQSISHDLLSRIDEYADYMGGLSKIVAPFEPEFLRYKGLIEPEHGLNTLTDDDVRRAVDASYDKFIDLRIPITTINVLFEAMHFLCRIAKGHTNDLPKDEAVVEFVTKRVDQVFDNVCASQISAIQQKRNIKKRKPYIFDKLLCWKTVTTGKCVKFDEKVQFIENNTPDDGTPIDYKPTSSCRHRKHPTLNTLAKAVFETPDLRDLPEIPTEMNENSLAHLYKHEKNSILRNLNRLEDNLNLKVHYYLKLFVAEDSTEHMIAGNRDEIVQYAVESVLTLPEKDKKFGSHVTKIADILANEIRNRILLL